MSSGLAIGMHEAGRGRAPAFLPADLRPDPQGGLYQGLYKRLRGFILDGVWPAGTRLPSSRALAADLKVSRNTAILAVEQLIADGWAESRSRSGVYVSAALAAKPDNAAVRSRPAPAELPPLALQRPATDLFPAQIWKQLQAAAWAQIEPQRLLTADPAGDLTLRETVARLVCAPRGIRCQPDQILIVSSAAMAMDLVAATLLRPGDRVVLEDPCRPALRQLLRSRGARICNLPVDGDGLDTDLLTDAADARLACVTPLVQFPTGAAMSAGRRAALRQWAQQSRGWIVEDDRDAELWFGSDGPPLPLAAEEPERTILIGSFNRLLFPGLCVAYLVAPMPIAERLRSAHATIGARASLASQLALQGFIAEGHFTRLLRQRRAAYAERRLLLSEAIGLPGHSGNGLQLVVPVRPGSAPILAATLAAERLGGADLDQFSESRRHGDRVLLGLGAPPDQLRACASRLNRILSPALACESDG
ncbi:PLP-dependent aminotransferase family protein [Sphingomonas sp. ID1715]|uniref:aminotransferase-like domain-containing protein n=1 Tax=Sphingomonas sp. ID1715 TaxID=1656898 RepID=UPI001C2C498F